MIYQNDNEILAMLQKKFPNHRNFPKSSKIIFSNQKVDYKRIDYLIAKHISEDLR